MFIILSLFIFSSCSLQKRIYTKGFYISNHQTSKTSKASFKEDTLPSVSFISKVIPIKKAEIQNTLLTLVSTSSIKSHRNKNEPIQQPSYSLLEACDTIVLKNGTKIAGAITDVKNNKVYFKNCGSADYFTSVINQTDVMHLIYVNGKNTRDAVSSHQKKRNIGNLIIGILLLGLGLLLLRRLLLGISLVLSTILLLWLLTLFLVAFGIALLITYFVTRQSY